MMPPGIDAMGVEVALRPRRRARRRRRGHDAAHPARAPGPRRSFPSRARVLPPLRPDRERLKRAKPDAIVLHPGPMNRGVEIASEVADGPRLGDPRPGRQRRGGAHGGALPARRRARGGRREAAGPAAAAWSTRSQGLDGGFDLLLEDGVVGADRRAIAPPTGAEVLDAAGLVVAPGLIDIHVHLREPGQEYKETVAHRHRGGRRRRLHRGRLHGEHRAGQRQRAR